MKLVASAQLARDAKAAKDAAPLYTNLEPIFSKLPKNENADKKFVTVVVTSSRGLCGALNSMLIRDVVRGPDYPKTNAFIYGDKGVQVCFVLF
jgi:F0F1-type ATP synthase gamma subunit